MVDSAISDVEGIREIIFKNVNGEIIFTKSMRTAHKISNSDSSKHQDNAASRTEDSVKSNIENTNYLVFKSDGEVTHTFVKVSDIQNDCAKLKIGEGSDDYDPEGRDECGTGSSQVNRTIASLMSEYKRDRIPQHPHFSSKTKRLLSFIDWPIRMRQKPEELADAGFFYTGYGDKTMCFHCGGGLKDWEDDDDPWQQHAQWFSQCAYVKLKGEFV